MTKYIFYKIRQNLTLHSSRTIHSKDCSWKGDDLTFRAIQCGTVTGYASDALPMRRLYDPGWITTTVAG